MIIGHTAVLTDLRTRISQGRLAHANLLVGPAGVGVFHSAHTLAQEMVSHPSDLIVLDSDSPKIADVRALDADLQLSPVGDTRIVIVRNIENMRIDAQNAFLKTLEEPPLATTFFLTCSHGEGVLETIRSRCTSFGFRMCSPTDLRQGLFHLGYSADQVDPLLSLPVSPTAGNILRLLKDDEACSELAEFQKNYDLLFTQFKPVSFFALAEKLSSEKTGGNTTVLRFLEGFVISARKRLLDGSISEEQLSHCVRMLNLARSTQVNRRLLLEEGFLHLHF